VCTCLLFCTLSMSLLAVPLYLRVDLEPACAPACCSVPSLWACTLHAVPGCFRVDL
jgi:hypothetical protein